jgi:DNA polymerase-4
MGAQRALGRAARPPGFLEAALVGLVDRLARRLRGARRTCRTVTLRLRFGDYSRATRSQTLPEATAHTQTILATARGLLVGAAPLIRSRGITLLGVSLSNLSDDDAIQLALPFDRVERSALDAALDDIRDRYGASAITRATLVGREQGPTVPLLPD